MNPSPLPNVAILLALLFSAGGCLQQPWNTMQVEAPKGGTPKETFAEFRLAAWERDWPKMYGCLTPEARKDQLDTLLMDAAHLAFVAKREDGSMPQIREREPVSPNVLKRAKQTLAVLEKHGLRVVSSNEPKASEIRDPDTLIPELWDATTSGAVLVDAFATLGEVNVQGDWAFAKVSGFSDRYGREGWEYVHFKRVDGIWLIDSTPWWMPWGPPPHMKRREP